MGMSSQGRSKSRPSFLQGIGLGTTTGLRQELHGGVEKGGSFALGEAHRAEEDDELMPEVAGNVGAQQLQFLARWCCCPRRGGASKDDAEAMEVTNIARVTRASQSPLDEDEGCGTVRMVPLLLAVIIVGT